MAIQLRRGSYENFDPQKMKPAEVGVVQSGDPTSADGKAVYVAIQSGDVKRMASLDELEDYNDQSEAILQQVQAQNTTIQQVYQRTNERATDAEQAASDAEQLKADTQQLKADVQTLYNNAESAIQGYTATAEQSIASTLADAQSAIADAQQDGIDAVEQVYQQREAEINAKVDQMIATKTSAEQIATEARNKADNLENELSEVASKTDRNQQKLTQLSGEVDDMIHSWYINVKNELIFTDADGNPIGEPISGIGGGGGSGGGGSTTNAEMKATNTTGWISNSVSKGAPVSVRVTWYSVENDLPTGNGVVSITVNGLIKATYEVPQGEIVFDLTNYLSSGSNNVKIGFTDVYDQRRVVGFNISVLDLRIESSFNTAVPFDGVISFPFTPYGDIEKAISIEVDNIVIHTQNTSSSGRQMNYTIPAQSHGAHTLRAYFDCEVNNQTVRSNVLYYEFISLETMNDTPIIISNFTSTTAKQYENIIIPYRVYTPTSETTAVEISVNNSVVATPVVDRAEQTFTYRANTAGTNTIVIRAGAVTKTFTLNVSESSVIIQPETENLALYLSAEGRNNNEVGRDVWAYNNISSTFTNFNWRRDGWQQDSEGATVLRLSDDARLTIPYNIFGTDFKNTGKTIEIEFGTSNVSNYNSVIISCMSDNIGLQLTSQEVIFRGAQTSTNQLYKDNEHIRVSFVVQKQTTISRLILIYINGIMSRAIQYASGERFSQLNPVGITIGSNDCDVDIYNIRVYDNDLSRKQVLNNWIADAQIGSTMIDRYNHNNVYDASDNITVNTLPKDVPYFILEAAELPQFKGDKKTITGRYVDPVYSSRSFTFTGCQINVQGTSSAPYFRKNYDMQFKQGFVTPSGTLETYELRPGSIPFNRFVLKADVASSESANNTKLTMFYNDTCPYKTPEMRANSKVRWGIEGIPIVVFWYDTENQTTNFLGKYNFNLPKRAPTPLGYSGNMESWEWQRNNSDNVKFKDDDFTSTYFDNDQQTYLPSWYQDFEARMPEDTWRDYAQLKEMISWVKSTYREQATGNALAEPVVYTMNTNTTVIPYSTDDSFTVVKETSGGAETGNFIITFTKDTAAYRLTKFRAEFDNYFQRESVLFYYLFTELFLMIDSRAKNMFIGFRGEPLTDTENRAMTRRAVCEPYDMDTAIGTNNSGVLMFGYALEDTDTVSSIISGSGEGGSSAPVYNAQDSVLWNNVRDAFKPELIQMYRTLRSSGGWSYNNIKTMFEEHQAIWPEAVFNEDAYIKYIYPVVEPVTVDEDTGQLIRTTRYLTMLQGSKEEQRKWWLYNRFKYLDSKYTGGTANTNVISARLFADGDITITTTGDAYATVQFGGGNALNTQRTTANTPVTFNYTAPSGVTEMETYIYSSDIISSIGDMSGFYPNEVDFSRATKLKALKLGDGSANYSNANLTTFDVSNSTLLESIDVRNCPNLAITVNLENSPRLVTGLFEGTKVTSVDIADGGAIETLHLPNTITALVLLNLNKLSDLQIAGYSNISRLMLANISTSVLNPITVLQAIRANSQVNIQGLYLEAQNATEIESWFDLFDTMSGVTREKDANGNWLYYEYDTAIISGEIHTYSLTGAEIASFNSRYPYITVTADHVTSYLTYKSWDGATTVKTVTCIDGTPQESSPSGPVRTATAQYNYTFVGWNLEMDASTNDASAITNVIADRTVYAAYSRTVRSHTITFVRASADGGGTLQSSAFPYGSTPSYTGATPTTTQGSATDYPFEGWVPAISTVTGPTTYTAKFGSPVQDVEITDSWDTIIANIDNGTYATKYKIGNYKPLDLGAEGTINMQIVAFDADELASGGYAPISFIAKELLNTKHKPTVQTDKSPWTDSTFYTHMQNNVKPLIPSNIRSRLQNVEKTVSKYGGSTEEVSSDIWIPTRNELYTRKTYPNNDSRIKTLAGTASQYWLADHGTGSWSQYYITTTGTSGSSRIFDYTYAICPCFCLGLEPETITDSWETILANENPSSTYSIGDTKYLDLGTEGNVLMEIVAFNEDDKADGSGKAKITWISKNQLNTTQKMNASQKTVDGETAYTAGGWEHSDMRAYLKETVKQLIPETVRNAIVPVTKVQSIYTGGALVKNGQTTTDDVWIPSNHEVGFGSDYETTGAVYSSKFTNSASRNKRNGSANSWWLRSVHITKNNFRSVNNTGSSKYGSATGVNGVALGFCT